MLVLAAAATPRYRSKALPSGKGLDGSRFVVPQREESNMGLKGSKTEQNLKDAFAGESQANRRYLYFASKADVEGQNDVAALFRSTAEGETGHAHGHLDYLAAVGDPATDLPIGSPPHHPKGARARANDAHNGIDTGRAQ